MFEISDPRLEGVSIAEVELNGDGSMARVYFSLLADGDAEAAAAEGFRSANRYLRRELGRRARLRTVPELEFRRDTSYAYGAKMEALLDDLRASGQLPETDDDSAGRSDPDEGES